MRENNDAHGNGGAHGVLDACNGEGEFTGCHAYNDGDSVNMRYLFTPFNT
uniref:Uncharacterized protein n=1 Tax=Arundo donax TaxID=35708 RepID=A0A0A9GVN2_ARUDO